MKHVKVILIITALLTNHSMYNAENTSDINQTIKQPLLESSENVESKEKTEKEVELNDMQQWNNHLELLTIQGEYWDATDNVPSDSWQSNAFDLAEKVIKKDKNSAEQLKTSFFDAIKAKITLEKGEFSKETTNLISAFDEKIKELLTPAEPIQEVKEVIPTPPTPEVTTPAATPEPVSEPAPSVPVVDTSASTMPTNSATSTTESSQPKNLKTEWKTILESIEQDTSVGESLDKAYELTRELLLSGEVSPAQLEKQFNEALTARAITKKLDPSVIDSERAYFKMNLAQQLQSPITQPKLNSIPAISNAMNKDQREKQQEFEKLQAEYAEKDAKLKQELEKQKQKEEQEKIVLAAVADAEKRGALTKKQQQDAHYSAQLKAEQDRHIKEKLAEEVEKLKQAQDALTKNIQQMAQAQKAPAPQGMFSAFTQAVGDWWYGEQAQQSTGLSSKEQDDFIATLVQGTKNPQAAAAVFKDFQRTLLGFNTPLYWNSEKEMPNMSWINYMQELLKDIVITYEIMRIEKACAIIEQVFAASPQMASKTKAAIAKIIKEIQRPTQEELTKQKAIEIQQQEKKQRIQERKDQLLREQQKIKEEKEQQIMEEKQEKERQLAQVQQHQANITNYKSYKDDWYNVLYNLASHQKATSQSNHDLTHQALQKSQAILQLAQQIPTKNKKALSQKLKQKFSIALLEQQKRNKHDINIYHHMDIFNQEINKMIE